MINLYSVTFLYNIMCACKVLHTMHSVGGWTTSGSTQYI